MTPADLAVQQLWRSRSRSRLLRYSALALAALVAYAWLAGDISPAELWQPDRLDNLRLFLTQEALPYPLRNSAWEWGALFEWALAIVRERGLSAASATLGISVLAMTLAGIVALLVVPLTARTIATAEPFLSDPKAGRLEPLWRGLASSVRLALVLLRAIPEYVWAFLLLSVLGPSAWPAILALAIHNAGILGRLGSEVVENLEPAPLRAWRGLGATRLQIVSLAVPPLAMGRFLLYFFYRFETCIREATVLGMLGILSLGYWIQDARSRQFHDDMLLLMALGILIVLLADLFSLCARSYLRRAS